MGMDVGDMISERLNSDPSMSKSFNIRNFVPNHYNGCIASLTRCRDYILFLSKEDLSPCPVPRTLDHRRHSRAHPSLSVMPLCNSLMGGRCAAVKLLSTSVSHFTTFVYASLLALAVECNAVVVTINTYCSDPMRSAVYDTAHGLSRTNVRVHEERGMGTSQINVLEKYAVAIFG